MRSYRVDYQENRTTAHAARRCSASAAGSIGFTPPLTATPDRGVALRGWRVRLKNAAAHPLNQSRSPSLAQRAFQCGTVPMGQVRGRLIRALQEFHQLAFGVRRNTHGVVGQDEFAQLLGEERLLRAYGGGGEPLR